MHAFIHDMALQEPLPPGLCFLWCALSGCCAAHHSSHGTLVGIFDPFFNRLGWNKLCSGK